MSNEQPLYEQVNNWRVFPRLFSVVYLVITYKVLEPSWTVPMAELTAEYTGIIASVVGASAAWFKFYVQSGANSINKNKSE